MNNAIKMLNNMNNFSRCAIVSFLIIMYGVLLSIPMIISIFTITTYFDLTTHTAIAISVTVICALIHLSLINIQSSIILYDNMVRHIKITQ